MKIHTTAAVLVLAGVAGTVDAHGRLLFPPHRGYIGKLPQFKGLVPINYSDNGLSAGGIAQTSGGKHGICGDPYTGVREHESGGTYGLFPTLGSAVVGACFAPGATIDLQAQVTANHMGYFEFGLCKLTKKDDKETEECFQNLKQPSGEEQWPVPSGNNVFNVQYVLPKDVTCEGDSHCIIRWLYVGGNNFGVPKNQQEMFWNCADVYIGTCSGGNFPTIAPTPPPSSGSPSPPYTYAPASPTPSAPTAEPTLPAPTTPTQPRPTGGIETILSKAQFQQIFPSALPIYTYENLVAVSKLYPAFANTGNADVDRREVAAFLGQISLESGDLRYVEEINKSTMCQASTEYPCAAGKQYFGRGPIQLSWNYNYKDFGKVANLDLVASPELVATRPDLVWWSALWFWNADKWNGNIHDVVGQPGGFAYTTFIINGGMECGLNPPNRDSEKSRIASYKKFCDLLGVAPGDNLSCQTADFPPKSPWTKPPATLTPPSSSTAPPSPSAPPTLAPQPSGPSSGVTKRVTWNFFSSGTPDCFASLTKDDLNNGLFAGAENIPADCGKTATFTFKGKSVTVTYAWRTTGGQLYNVLSPQAFANLIGANVNISNYNTSEAVQKAINDPGHVSATCNGTCGILPTPTTTAAPVPTTASLAPTSSAPTTRAATTLVPPSTPAATTTASPTTTSATPTTPAATTAALPSTPAATTTTAPSPTASPAPPSSTPATSAATTPLATTTLSPTASPATTPAATTVAPPSTPTPAPSVVKLVSWNWFASSTTDCDASLSKDTLNRGLYVGGENIPADCGKTASFTYKGVTVTATYAWRTTGGQRYNELSPQAFANILGVKVDVANFTTAEALQLAINDPGHIIANCVGVCGVSPPATTAPAPTTATPTPTTAPVATTPAPTAAFTPAPSTIVVTPAPAPATSLPSSTLAPTVEPTSAPTTVAVTPAPTAALTTTTTAPTPASTPVVVTPLPTVVPTAAPTTTTLAPTAAPTTVPATSAPTDAPTVAPTLAPTSAPTTTLAPTAAPTTATPTPTTAPTFAPTTSTLVPTSAPTTAVATLAPPPTSAPTVVPTALPTSFRPTIAPTTAAPGNPVRDQLVNQHNKIRAAHGVGPLTWDDALAPKMQQWADSCPGFQHGGPSGWQNLATYTPCGATTDCAKVVGAAWLWYNDEETYWNYGTNTCNGDWAKCGHFSNLISPEVKSIACGWSQCANGNYVWCNYNTPVKNPKVAPLQGITKAQVRASLVN